MPPINTIVKFNPSRLNAQIAKGFRQSVYATGIDAKTHAPVPKAGAVATVRGSIGYLRPTGLGIIYEKGRQGGYEINPGAISGVRSSFSRKTGSRSYKVKGGTGDKTALKFTGGDGGFAAYAIGGPMAARPYLRPAAARWANGGSQAAMRRALLSGGFR